MKKNKEIYLEEAVLDDFAKDFDLIELPLSEKAFRLIKIVIFCAVLLVVERIFLLGIVKNAFYKNQAVLNSSEQTTLAAERGIIFDKFDKPLVSNSSTLQLTLKIVNFVKNQDEREKTTNALKEILQFTSDNIAELFNKIKDIDLEKQNSVIVAEITSDQAKKIKNLNLNSLEIKEIFKRNYSSGYIEDPLRYSQSGIFSHLIGYTAFADKNDLEKNPSLSFDELVGKSGIEAYYNEELQGENGVNIGYRNSSGEIFEKKHLSDPKPGENLYLTIDSEFQSYFYNRFKERLNILGRNVGVGIALNPQNGEILSLISIPGFNNNKISPESLTNPLKPFFNRAISGEYSPGSTIKPLVAVAALKEKVIDPLKEILSVGFIEIPNPYNPSQPSRFLDWKPNGWVNLYSALARSSNVYFYEVGGGFEDQKGLGINKLNEYWRKFGLGIKTGIDLPGEKNGFLPYPSEKEKRTKTPWRIGDTYNVSIGQGDLLLTPIQLINYIALIANNGKNYEPHLNKEKQIKELINLSDLLPEIKEIQKGMADVVNQPYGTANTLNDLPFSVAAKTGTAQIESNAAINAIFVGYAPVEDPQIAVLILVENAKEGSVNTLPIAKEILMWYYQNRIKNN